MFIHILLLYTKCTGIYCTHNNFPEYYDMFSTSALHRTPVNICSENIYRKCEQVTRCVTLYLWFFPLILLTVLRRPAFFSRLWLCAFEIPSAPAMCFWIPSALTTCFWNPFGSGYMLLKSPRLRLRAFEIPSAPASNFGSNFFVVITISLTMFFKGCISQKKLGSGRLRLRLSSGQQQLRLPQHCVLSIWTYAVNLLQS